MPGTHFNGVQPFSSANRLYIGRAHSEAAGHNDITTMLQLFSMTCDMMISKEGKRIES